jgi:molybdopterin converting factor subunit 1
MAIRVLFFATLADIAGRQEVTIDAGGIEDAGAVFDRMAASFPLLESRRTSTLIAVNSEFARPDTPVHDGDEVAFLPPVSGG